MSKNKRKRKRPGGQHHAAASAPSLDDLVSELNDCILELEQADDPHAAGPVWGAVHKLLLKSPADPSAAARVIATRDIDALRAIIDALQHGERGEHTLETPAEKTFDIPDDTLKRAMQAFRKRLKLTRLDHESRLGVGPMTSGKKAEVDAILAPREFDDEVWEALVQQGKLKSAGGGFYSLVRGLKCDRPVRRRKRRAIALDVPALPTEQAHPPLAPSRPP